MQELHLSMSPFKLIIMKNNEFPPNEADNVDFAKLYDDHPEYAARRVNGSYEQEKITIEVNKFKLPNLASLLQHGWLPRRVIEIGCATGELIADFPVSTDGQRVGVDLSDANIVSARERFLGVEFHAGDFTGLSLQVSDCVILSDILEHVEDDAIFLSKAASLGKFVLVNLPLEDNWLNRNRNYGVHDDSGHLRKYTLGQGLDLFKDANLKVLQYRQVWAHETNVLNECRQLHRRYFGTEYSGNIAIRMLKRLVMQLACTLRPIGRRLFASNLFVIAQNNSNS